jgi:hypothetical protein
VVSVGKGKEADILRSLEIYGFPHLTEAARFLSRPDP